MRAHNHSTTSVHPSTRVQPGLNPGTPRASRNIHPHRRCLLPHLPALPSRVSCPVSDWNPDFAAIWILVSDKLLTSLPLAFFSQAFHTFQRPPSTSLLLLLHSTCLFCARYHFRVSLRVSVRASHPFTTFSLLHLFPSPSSHPPPSLAFCPSGIRSSTAQPIKRRIYILHHLFASPSLPRHSEISAIYSVTFSCPIAVFKFSHVNNHNTTTITGNTTANRHCTFGLTRRFLFSGTSLFRYFTSVIPNPSMQRLDRLLFLLPACCSSFETASPQILE